MKTFLQTLFSFLLVTQMCFAQWVQISGPSGGINCLAVSGTNLFVGNDYGVFLSTNQGTDWTSRNSGLVPTPEGWYLIEQIVVSGEYLFVATFSQGIFRSSDNGSNWVYTNSGVPLFQNTAIAAEGSTIIAVSGQSVSLSTDNGTNWSVSISDSLPNSSINCLAMNGENIFAGYTYSGVYASNDSGATWHATWNQDSLQLIWSVGGLITQGNYLFAGSYSHLAPSPHWPFRIGVFVSLDDEQSWLDSGFSNDAFCLAMSIKNLFVGTFPSGVFVSADNGSSWTDVSTGLGGIWAITTLIADSEYLFAWNADGSFWRRPLSEITYMEELSITLPSNYNLSQNYPNPFNPSTTFRYSIPNESKVLIKVYDILGKEIETLVNEEKPLGTYDVTWNAASLPSGVYFYQLRAGNFVDTKKMILLK